MKASLRTEMGEVDTVDMRDTIRKLEDLTPTTIILLQKSHKEKVTFPNLRVEHDEFLRLQSRFPCETEPTFEYLADSKEIVMLSPPSPIHQQILSTLGGWLNDVGEEISTNQQAYYAMNGCEIELADGSSKVPDTVLTTNTFGSYPIVAVEVGVNETLEKLYQDAEVLLKGSRGLIQLVIILKASETGQCPNSAHSWGKTTDQLSNMGHAGLVSTIEEYSIIKEPKIVGDLSVDVFLYPKDRESRPRQAVYSFSHPLPQIADHFKNPPMIHIKGQKFRFPVEKVQIAIERGVANEKTRRVFKV